MKETIEWTPFTQLEFRIKGYWSFDTPPKRYYKIIERVTPAFWIDLPGIYGSEKSAQKEIDRLKVQEGK